MTHIQIGMQWGNNRTIKICFLGLESTEIYPSPEFVERNMCRNLPHLGIESKVSGNACPKLTINYNWICNQNAMYVMGTFLILSSSIWEWYNCSRSSHEIAQRFATISSHLALDGVKSTGFLLGLFMDYRMNWQSVNNSIQFHIYICIRDSLGYLTLHNPLLTWKPAWPILTLLTGRSREMRLISFHVSPCLVGWSHYLTGGT